MTALPERNSEVENVVVLDFGSQTARLIARRVRECNVYSELRFPEGIYENINDFYEEQAEARQ